MFGLISSFLSNRWLGVVLDGKPSQEYPVITKVYEGFILGPTLLLLYIYNLPDVICDIAFYNCDTILYSKWNQTSDLWQQLELVSELESDLQDTVDQGNMCLIDFNAGKTQLISFHWSNNNTGSIDEKMDGSAFEEKSSFKMMKQNISSKLSWGSYIISTAKTTSRKTGALIRYMKSLSPEVALYLYQSTICLYMEHNVVRSGLVSLVAIWNCQTSYKN